MTNTLKFGEWLKENFGNAMFMRGDDLLAQMRKENPVAADKWEADQIARKKAAANAPTQHWEPPKPKPPQPRQEPSIDSNPEMFISGGSVEGKLIRLISDLSKIDPQRAKWFSKIISRPSNAHRLERLTAQITTVPELLKLINNLERKQRSRPDTIAN